MQGSILPQKQSKKISWTQRTSVSRPGVPPSAQHNGWKQSHTKHASEKFQNAGDKEKVRKLPERKNTGPVEKVSCYVHGSLLNSNAEIAGIVQRGAPISFENDSPPSESNTLARLTTGCKERIKTSHFQTCSVSEKIFLNAHVFFLGKDIFCWRMWGYIGDRYIKNKAKEMEKKTLTPVGGETI